MRFGEGLLEDILRRTDLVQLVGRRIKLERRGRIFWGLCPFHKEKSPSFKVENERRTYHCFGCGKGGDAFKWLTETEGLSFPEAVQKLAGEAGVEMPNWSPEDEARETRRKSLYEIVALACQFFEDQLRTRAATPARDYLKSRGLTDAICKRFHIGYAPDGNSALKDHLLARGVSLEDMVEVGLVRPADDGRPARDFFYDRVTFAIADTRGRIVAFGARGLAPDAKPKYINTGETPLFSKGRMLYNFQTAREAAFKTAPLIVAEGYMDVIALVENGFPGACAPLGTALTEDQLAMLWKVAPEPVLCFDGDEAGRRAAKRASRLALPFLAPGQSLRFVFLPGGEDPDSYLKSQGSIALQALLDKALPLTDVLWNDETEGRDFSTPERRAGLEAELSSLIKAIRDPKIADYYKRDFDERVFKAFKQRKAAPPNSPYGGRNSGQKQGFRGDRRGGRPPLGGASQDGPSAAVRQSLHAVNAVSATRKHKEMELAGLLLGAPGLVERHAEQLAEFSFSDGQLDRLKHELLNLAASGTSLDRTVVENHLVRQGMGVLSERLSSQRIVQTAGLDTADEAAHEDAWLRVMAQLRDPDSLPDSPLGGDLKSKRDEALARYLDQGGQADWDELQRLNGMIRAAGGQNP